MIAWDEGFHLLGAVPVFWLLLTRNRNVAYWWIAFAFSISWFADTAAHWVQWEWVSLVYPMSQAAIIGAVFLSRKDAEHFAIVLAGTALLAATVGGSTPDIVVHTVAFGGLSLLLWPLKSLGLMRVALLVSFGGWLIGWYLYCAAPGWFGYMVYESCRALGILLFCRATMREQPVLRVA